MIIVTGSVAYDYIMDFPGSFGDHILPDKIHKLNLSFIVNKFSKRRGGTAGNVSYSLALLKTPHTLFSVVGNDFDDFKKPFKKLGIDISHVKIEKNSYTATGFAMTDKNNNQIWGYFYGAAELSNKLQLRSVAQKDDLVLVGPVGATGTIHMVKQCIAQGVSYMFDPGFVLTEISNKDLLEGVVNATYIIGNDYEIELIQSRIKNWKTIFQDKTIIKTLGEKGAEIVQGNKKYTIPAVKVERVIDPTGAGDAWRSGFLAGLSRKLDLQICGQMGATAASFALEKYGTQEHSYTLPIFKKRYRQTYGNLIGL